MLYNKVLWWLELLGRINFKSMIHTRKFFFQPILQWWMFLDKIGIYESNCSSIISIKWCSIWSSFKFTISTWCLLAYSRVGLCCFYYLKNFSNDCYWRSMEFRPKSLSDAASRFRTNSISSVLSMVWNENRWLVIFWKYDCILG